MNALADPRVGEYLNDHAICAYQKVGTFKVVNGQKQGGNVASYFCLGDGSTLHAIAGPVDAATFLKEARWVVELRKLALFEARGNTARYREIIRHAHLDRLKQEYGIDLVAQVNGWQQPGAMQPFTAGPWSKIVLRGADKQSQVHTLLAYYPLAKIETIYKYVFEKILGEKISTLPVEEK